MIAVTVAIFLLGILLARIHERRRKDRELEEALRKIAQREERGND